LLISGRLILKPTRHRWCWLVRYWILEFRLYQWSYLEYRHRREAENYFYLEWRIAL